MMRGWQVSFIVLLVLLVTSAGCASRREAREALNPPLDPSITLFDGRTLDGWRRVGGGATFEVEDGCIVGEVGPGPNTFLRTDETWSDFDLTLEVTLDVPGNSGIQFRSHQREGDEIVMGYQCEINPGDSGWSGGVYDEGGRGWLATLEGNPEAARAFVPRAWNVYRIRAVGNHIQTWVNEIPCADFHDDEESEGFIALQVHSGEQGRIRWRNIRLIDLSIDD